MAWFAFFALVLWLPVVFAIFEKYPIRKSIVYSFVTAWLFLPPTLIPLPGFPDWSKTTATVTSVMLCAWLKQSHRILGLKLQWYDVPVVMFCICPMISALVNGQGAYDGLSAVLDEVFRWGLPYLIGRAFLADSQGLRQLCLGIAVGGIVYVPLCVFELRMSPILNLNVYGFNGRGGMDFGMRYGGYRPMVFLSFGLELGWWMCCATFASYLLWASGSVKKISGYPMSVLTLILALVTIACKATGALTLIILGFLEVLICKSTKTSMIVWAVLAIAPIYCVARPFGLMSGERLVSLSESTFGADRAQSLLFRFEQEELLMRNAMVRPIFGWSRNGGFNPAGPDGKSLTTDGYWIIVLGTMGYAGLISLNAMLLVPTALFVRRFPVKTWQDPDVASITALAIILPLFMIDNLSNAMLNPIYSIAMGAVSGYLPSAQRAKQSRSSAVGESQPDRQLGANTLAIEGESYHDVAANQFESDAIVADDQGINDEAETLFRQAIQSRQAAIQSHQTPSRLDQLAKTHVLYARFLTKLGQRELAIVERERALAVWRSLGDSNKSNELSWEIHAANLNDLAWLLIADQRSDPTRIDQAVGYTEEAIQLAPHLSSFWNTLGIARYRRQDYHKAIYALSRSVSLSQDGGNAFDFYYLALANYALGYPKPTEDWLNRADFWARRHPELGLSLRVVQDEAFEKLRRAEISEKLV